jgi:phosphate transport system substrate-binding protein
VVQGVNEDLYGMGYSGIGYKTSGVKTLALAKKAGETYYGTDAETVLSGKYPLSRYLYLYVNKTPNKPLDPLVREFVKFVLSRAGQETVVKDGYLPISSKLVDTELAKLD